MSVPTGWLPAGSGSGSAQSAALLPVPAVGYYLEPADAVLPLPSLPTPLVVTSEINGGGTVTGGTDNATVSAGVLTRLTVYGALLLDSIVTADLGAPTPCPRPPLTPITACPRPENV